MNTQRNKRRLTRLAAAFAVAVLLLPVRLTAYGMNGDYLEPKKWAENPDAVCCDVDVPGRGEHLQGAFRYFTDGDMCLYTYFSLDCTAFDAARDNARITFEIHTENETYSVSVDKDGICNTLPGSEAAVDVISNFDGRASGEFLAAVQYRGKETACTVDVSFYASVSFTVSEGILLERQVTTKPAPTTRQATTKSSRTTTTNAKTSAARQTTASRPNVRAAAEVTTKFVPQGSDYFSETEAETAEGLPAAYTGTAERAPMSGDAVILLVIGIVLLTAGIITVTVSRLKSRKTAATENSEPLAQETE